MSRAFRIHICAINLNHMLKKIAFIPVMMMAVFAVAQDKKEFKPSGKLWGYAYADYFYKLNADSLGRGTGEYSGQKQHTNAFDIRRAYLGYDYSISENIAAEFLLSHEKNFDASSNRIVFIKAANVKWKEFIPKNDLVLGLSGTPAWGFVTEKVWGYRSVERTLFDMHKTGNSNDLGIALQGRLDSAGFFGYNLMAGNGTGSKAENDKYKKMYGEVYAKLMKGKLILDLYADFERSQLTPYFKSRMSNKFMIAWQSEKITAGVELFRQIQQNQVIYTDTASGKGDTTDASLAGLAIFIRGAIVKDKLNFFLRTDLYNPDQNYNDTYVYAGSYGGYTSETFFLAGIEYAPVKNVRIIPNVWYYIYKSRVKGASGKTATDYDLVPRVTLHYIFK